MVKPMPVRRSPAASRPYDNSLRRIPSRDKEAEKDYAKRLSGYEDQEDRGRHRGLEPGSNHRDPCIGQSEERQDSKCHSGVIAVCALSEDRLLF